MGLTSLINSPSRLSLIGGETVETINARDLHKFLEVRSKFSDWISRRIKGYGFVENEDFLRFLEKSKGRPRVEYYISIDMAKHLAMVERNEKGKQARQYFIECEKELVRTMHLLAIINATTNEERDLALEAYEARYAGRLNKPLIATL